MIAELLESRTSEQEFNLYTNDFNLDWAVNLSEQEKDAVIRSFFTALHVKPTSAEFLALGHVVYRTASGGTFTESVDNVAEKAGCDRKTIIKGLNQAVEQNILQRNKRPGTTDEYSFKPVEEWLPEPVIHKTDIRTRIVIPLPETQQPTETTEIESLPIEDMSEDVQKTDTQNLDTNMFVVSLDQIQEEEQQLLVVSVQKKDGHWKYIGRGFGRVYMPPELSEEAGMQVESIHEATKRPRQLIIESAMEDYYNRLNRKPSFMDEDKLAKPKKFTAVGDVVENIVQVNSIPESVLQALTEAGIELNPGVADRLWVKYSEKFGEAIAYTLQQDEAGKIKQSKEGFFRACLEKGWSIKPSINTTVMVAVDADKGDSQREWYELACQTGVCDGRAFSDLAPTWNGDLAVFVYIPAPNPMLPPYVSMPISQAMRDFPIEI